MHLPHSHGMPKCRHRFGATTIATDMPQVAAARQGNLDQGSAEAIPFMALQAHQERNQRSIHCTELVEVQAGFDQNFPDAYEMTPPSRWPTTNVIAAATAVIAN